MSQPKSVVSSPAPLPPLVKLNKTVTLKLSERLQNQILQLCTRINTVEWSSTLFYKIEEGNFGEDYCVLHADTQYLQDIGTQAYTEYEFGPDYFQYLMANPEMMDYKQGHLHSHNSMNVFFSGTDDKELIVNSEFHNYYLSLIVNNLNEMTARVAFRVTKRSKIAKAITSTLEYRDSDGTIKTTDPEASEQAEEKVETTVYYFDCNIIKPVVAAFDNVLSARIDAIQEKKRVERLPKPGAFSSYKGQDYGNFTKDFQQDDWAKDKNLRTGPRGNSSVGKRYSIDREQHTLFDVDDAIDGALEKKPKLSKKAIKRLVGEDKQTAAFLVALLTSDPLCIEGIGAVLDKLDDTLDSKFAVTKLVAEVETQLLYIYMSHYPADQSLNGMKDVILKAANILEYYEDTYDYIVQPVVHSLRKQVDGWK